MSFAFQGHLQLLDWGDNKRGRRVVFEVMDDVENPMEVNPFKEFTSKNGKIAGQIFAAVLVEVDPATGDPKKPLSATQLAAEPAPERAAPGWDDMKPSQRAAVLCKDAEFQQWLRGEGFPGCDSEKAARDALCHMLDIDSRSKLDTKGIAFRVFETHVDAFHAWRDEKFKPKLGGK